MKITMLGSGSSGGVPLIGNYWGECDPKNKKNIRTRVSVLVSLDNGKNIVQKSFFIRLNDDKYSLQVKTQRLEYIAYPEAIIKIFRYTNF